MIRKAPSPVPFEGGLECRPENRAAPALVIEPTGRRFAPPCPSPPRDSRETPSDRAGVRSRRPGHPADRPAAGRPGRETTDGGAQVRGRLPLEHGVPTAAKLTDAEIAQARRTGDRLGT
jgi:hypothetical protein